MRWDYINFRKVLTSTGSKRFVIHLSIILTLIWLICFINNLAGKLY